MTRPHAFLERHWHQTNTFPQRNDRIIEQLGFHYWLKRRFLLIPLDLSSQWRKASANPRPEAPKGQDVRLRAVMLRRRKEGERVGRYGVSCALPSAISLKSHPRARKRCARRTQPTQSSSRKWVERDSIELLEASE